jgi:hypothetical protein
MRTRGLLLLTALVVLVTAAPAHAKGPSEGTIEGEGLDAPLAIGYGEGTPGGDRIIEDVGFFEVTFGMTPSRVVEEAPTDDLGPRFVIRWRVPGPSGEDDEIVQELYPYADGGPLTYTEPGQPFFTTERTRGGWYRGPDRLLTTLEAMGLPALDDLEHGGSVRWAPIGASLAAVVLLGVGLAVAGRGRRRVAAAAG